MIFGLYLIIHVKAFCNYIDCYNTDSQWGAILLPCDIWQCLKTFLFITTWEVILALVDGGQGDDKYLTRHRRALFNIALSVPKCQ